VIKFTVVILEEYLFYQLHTSVYPMFVSRLTPYVDQITGNHEDFDVTEQLLIRYSELVRYCRRYGNKMGQ